ncbi:hypothetical protein IAI18_22720 [Acetobacteraceae bacterium H6797]|nr:hypothetical protein [Acetobacteraceae bacterium H6797]
MNHSKQTWEEWVTGAAEMAWPLLTPAGLVACSVRVDRESKRVAVAFHLDAELTEEEHDDLSDVEGSILVQLPDDWQTRLIFERLSPGQPTDLSGAEVIYRRGDTETPFERWQRKQSTGGAS